MRALLLLLCLPALPLAANPLAAVNRALLTGDGPASWQALQQSWPQLQSRAQRDSWQAALAALTGEHCGKDAPLRLPPWLPQLTLALTQRDMPLARSYRVTLSGRGRPEQWQLLDALGRDLLDGARREDEADNGFRLESADLASALAGGVYRLRLQAAGQEWQASLLLPVVDGLGWLGRHPLAVRQFPPAAAACPSPWLEQALLRRRDFSLLWWQRQDQPRVQRWPALSGELWQSVAVVRAETRGQLVLRIEQRQVGPHIP